MNSLPPTLEEADCKDIIMGQQSSKEEEAIPQPEEEEKNGLFGWLFSPNAGEKRKRHDDDDDVDEPGLGSPATKKQAVKQASLDGIPKPPVASYIAFSMERRAQVKREHPNASNGEVSILLGEEWRASAELREKYKGRQAKLKTEYQARMAALGLPIPKRAARTEKRSKQKSEDGKPKHPKRAFYLYSQEYRPILKKENPGASSKEISEILAQRWNKSPEGFRTKYLSEYGKLLKAYQEELATWREKQRQKYEGKEVRTDASGDKKLGNIVTNV